jgi:ABC-type nitrate/sulfonate/bicarbonate transport system substrate-binding protein
MSQHLFRPSVPRLKLGFGLLAVVVLTLLMVRPAWLTEWTGLRSFGTERLRLGAYEGDVGALEWIAYEQGFFDRVGLAVEISGFPSGKEAVAALHANRVDVATASEYVVAAEGFADRQLRVLANIAHYRNKAVVGRSDRGIAVPTDLRGKRIGLTSPSGAEYTLYVFLALNGLTPADVTIVNLAPQSLIDELTAGTIDAAITWQPHVQAMERNLGGNSVSFAGNVFDVYLLLVTKEPKLADQRKAMNRLLRAMVLAEEWTREHPDEAKAIVARRFGLEPAAVDAQWQQMRLAVTLPQDLLVAMDGEATWLAKRDGTAEAAVPNFGTFIAAEDLRQVKPAAVTLFAGVDGTVPPR